MNVQLQVMTGPRNGVRDPVYLASIGIALSEVQEKGARNTGPVAFLDHCLDSVVRIVTGIPTPDQCINVVRDCPVSQRLDIDSHQEFALLQGYLRRSSACDR